LAQVRTFPLASFCRTASGIAIMFVMKWLVLLWATTAAGSGTQTSVGPIQKVLQLLDELQAKAIKEGEGSQIAYEEFVDFCTKQATETKFAIKTSEEDIEALHAEIDTAQGYIDELGIEIGGKGAVEPGLTGQISKLEMELSAATALRKSAKADFDARDGDLAETADMLTRAHKVLGENLNAATSVEVGSSLAQLSSALKSVVDSSMVDIEDKKVLQSLLQGVTTATDGISFLAQPQAKQVAYDQGSSPALDTIAGLLEKAQASRAAGQKEEMHAQHSSNMYTQASTTEIASLTKQLDTAKKRLNANGEKKASAEGQLEIANKELAASQTFLQDTQQECLEKAAEWEQMSAERTNEIKTLAMAKKILGNQGALGLEQRNAAKNAVPSFLQTSMRMRMRMKRENGSPNYSRQLQASRYLRALAKDSHSWVLAQVSDKLSADPFGKVKNMLGEMITKLEEEQAAEAEHKAWCDKEMAKSTKDNKLKSSRVEELNIRAEKVSADITKTTEEAQVLVEELQDMDAASKEATQLRNKESTTWDGEKKEQTMGQEACAAAIKVLRSYYEGKSLIQTSAGAHAAITGPDGVIGLLEVAESDFSKAIAEGQAGEDQSASEYEQYMEDFRVSRATKMQDEKDKRSTIARLQALQAELGEDLVDSQKELSAVVEYLTKIKTSCTTKVPSHEERQERRAKEIAGLQNALGILDGTAVASLLQSVGDALTDA